MKALEHLTLRVYRRLTRAFPEEFQHAYGAEMVDAAKDTLQFNLPTPTPLSRIALLTRLLMDLVLRLAVEHWHDAVRDLRYAGRMLLRAKGFTLAAIVCLAIGIGLTTAVYSQIRSTVLRAVPGVSDGAGLVRRRQATQAAMSSACAKPPFLQAADATALPSLHCPKALVTGGSAAH